MKRKKITNKIALILIFLGILICLLPQINKVIFEVIQEVKIEIYEENFEEIPKEDIETKKKRLLDENKKIYEEDLFDVSNIENFENKDSKENDILGILFIPKIDVKLPIYEGTGSETLNKGIGHLEGSSNIIADITSHSVLAGHSGLQNKTMFDNLNKLSINDFFYIKVQDEILKYEVIEKNIILPDECNLSLKKEENLCTLVTCTPYRVNTHRLLITGKLTKVLNYQEFMKQEKLDSNNNFKTVIVKQIIFLHKNNNLKWILFIILVICAIIGSIKVLKRKEKKDDLYNR